MICPKCQNVMRTVDRQGIHIDQCDSCRGIFLDRGELEQILSAEERYHQAAAPPPYQGAPVQHMPPPPPAYPAQQHYPAPAYGHRDSPPGYGHRDSPPGYGHGGHYGGHKRRKSFLGELFD
ncbi:zf-TFIIB domain-containing protein [Actinokineospora sp. HUAS TT18]|uniref:TFIIB-type zinc ribbon-containing protein n=1 Tax=Actinokineospora sp. HUAS TT18 TaxID=3447451 RepID=UPI003F51DE54